MTVGRPSEFSDEIATAIVERLSVGEPLAVICREDGMPCDDTVRNWAKADEALNRAIADARVRGYDVIALRARRTLRGLNEPDNPMGGESTGDVQRDKAIADFDLKLLSKWDPKRFGDKVALVGGGDGDAPIKTVRRIERVIIDPTAKDA